MVLGDQDPQSLHACDWSATNRYRRIFSKMNGMDFDLLGKARKTSRAFATSCVIARRATPDSAVSSPLSGPGIKRTAARRSGALQTHFPQNNSLKCSVWMIWQRK